jgi:phage shock protein C
VIAGVCGGLAEYLEVDPILIRIGFVALTLAGGSGVLLYLISWLVIPEAEGAGPPAHRGDPRTAQVVIGGILIAVGGILIAERFAPWLDRVVWPLGLIVIGGAIILFGTRR